MTTKVNARFPQVVTDAWGKWVETEDKLDQAKSRRNKQRRETLRLMRDFGSSIPQMAETTGLSARDITTILAGLEP
jgi:hypothetical protein